MLGMWFILDVTPLPILYYYIFLEGKSLEKICGLQAFPSAPPPYPLPPYLVSYNVKIWYPVITPSVRLILAFLNFNISWITNYIQLSYGHIFGDLIFSLGGHPVIYLFIYSLCHLAYEHLQFVHNKRFC